MKAYKLLKERDGYPAGKLFYGPLPIQSNSATKGYYPEESLDTVPGTNLYFESYITSNPDIFEDMGETVDPRTKTDKTL